MASDEPGDRQRRGSWPGAYAARMVRAERAFPGAT